MTTQSLADLRQDESLSYALSLPSRYREEAIRDINRERRPAREKLFAGIQEAIERDEKK